MSSSVHSDVSSSKNSSIEQCQNCQLFVCNFEFQQKKGLNDNEMALRLLSTETDYVQSVLEEILDEISDTGTFLSLKESVIKSQERNREKNQIGYLSLNKYNKIYFLNDLFPQGNGKTVQGRNRKIER